MTHPAIDKMKSSKQAKKAILKALERASKSEQELVDDLVEEDMPRKKVMKALEKLRKTGKIVFLEEVYSLSDVLRGESISDEQTAEKEVPLAQILRERDEKEILEFKNPELKEGVDIDDEIRRLEAELAADDESDYESGDLADEEASTLGRDKRISFGTVQVKEIESSTPNSRNTTDDASVVCLSAVAQERIAPLPEKMLPKIKKRSFNGKSDDPPQKPVKKSKVGTGLRDAAKEVLSGYVARSSERLPFYCRVCAKQYTNEKEFFQHKSSDFHMTAVQVERKASFCKLCRKQFTSPVQLKEHLSSRPHKERLHHVQNRQPPRAASGQKGRSRQWC